MNVQSSFSSVTLSTDMLYEALPVGFNPKLPPCVHIQHKAQIKVQHRHEMQSEPTLVAKRLLRLQHAAGLAPPANVS